MSGIMHKIGETLHMGGQKEEEKHHGSGSDQHHKEGDQHHKEGDHHKSDQHGGEHKEGLVDKIKDKIHGDGGHDEKGEKKKKKEKKKHEQGHEHHGDSSSSSDSD